MGISAVVVEISEFERGFRKGSEIVDNFKHYDTVLRLFFS